MYKKQLETIYNQKKVVGGLMWKFLIINIKSWMKNEKINKFLEMQDL